MPADTRPKDENLRLVLSADQEQWLARRIREYRAFVGICAVLLVLSGGWLAASAAGWTPAEDDPGCFTVPETAPDRRELHDQFLEMGLMPCPPPDQAEDASHLGFDGHAWTTLLAAFVLFAALVGLLRNLFLLRTFRRYSRDHRAFLEKYHRT